MLAILNSKLFQYFLRINSRSKIDSYPDDWKDVPIKSISLDKQEPLVKLSERMISLNKKLSSIGNKKTSETAKIEEEIKRTDAEIDVLVYKLYGLTPEEIKIVEESLK